MNYPENGRETTKIATKYGPDWGLKKFLMPNDLEVQIINY